MNKEDNTVEGVVERAIQHALNCSFLLERGWYKSEEEQSLKDQVVLSLTEVRGWRTLDSPAHWSEYYKTEKELWKSKEVCASKRVTWSKDFREIKQLILEWSFWRLKLK